MQSQCSIPHGRHVRFSQPFTPDVSAYRVFALAVSNPRALIAYRPRLMLARQDLAEMRSFIDLDVPLPTGDSARL
jgi:hypothetical protein